MTQHKRLVHLNLLVDGAGHHRAAWRLGHTRYEPTSLAWHRRLIETAERGKLDAVSLLDSRALGADVDHTPQSVRPEALTLLAALAQFSQRIGLVAQASTQHTQPYNLARRLASLDHVSRGRTGWLIHDRSTPDEQRNFDEDDDPDATARSVEYLHVLRRLWNSWDDDARVIDKAAGQYVDIDRIRAIDHVGPRFRVSGPIDIPRPPQGQPPVWRRVAAGETPPSDADVLITQAASLAAARQDYRRLRAGRETPPLILPVVTLLCSPSESQRKRQQAELAAHADAHWPPPWPVIAGAPHEVARALLEWIDGEAADGFSLAPAVTAEGLDDVVDYLVPELQRLRRFRSDYAGTTLREHLGLRRPPAHGSDTPDAADADANVDAIAGARINAAADAAVTREANPI